MEPPRSHPWDDFILDEEESKTSSELDTIITKAYEAGRADLPLMRTRLIQRFIWHEGEVGTVLVGPSGIGKSTLIEQIRQVAADAGGTESSYVDPADELDEQYLTTLLKDCERGSLYLVATFLAEPPEAVASAIASGRIRRIDAEEFRFDQQERVMRPVLAGRIDARLGASPGSI